MCLDTVYRGKKKQEALAALPESITVWKDVLDREGCYYPEIWGSEPFKAGWNKTRPLRRNSGYLVAFHSFLKKTGACDWMGDPGDAADERIIKCKVEKKDITAIGKQVTDLNSHLVIVSTRIWIPKYRKKAV